ncbi:peptide methionine sulfoxide reductase-like [Uloborus diversus]|uniref:peptide methionine sulfoxide reductase-like n=1 Tax=Uloborus diversus TaxID=327109 RepID=UPI00240A6ECD|nr:peptide methionine sulfoxide reductase-like [Uloborus diversus]
MPDIEKAYFALACFWKPDAQFGCRPEVLRTRVGYCGGSGPAPNYPRVGDHTEAVEIQYDPSLISYENLLNLFWEFHDPCSCQKRQYMSAIFYTNNLQKALAEESKRQKEGELGKSIATEILPLNVFYEGEDYHQKYILRTYHRRFYNSLPSEDPVTSTRDAKLNGFLSGHGTLQEFETQVEQLNLSDDQVEYVKQHITKKLAPATVEPFIRTVIIVMWNYVKKLFGY